MMLKSRPGVIFAYTLSVVAVIVSVFPLFWIFIFSFLPEKAISAFPPQLFPTELYLDNYIYVIQRTNIVRGMTNSFVAVGFAVMIVLLFASIGAYGVAHSRPKYRRFVYVLLLVTQMVPAMTNMIPIYTIMNNIGLLNKRIGLSIVYAANNLPLSMLILIGFYLTSVVEIEEAAMIDGCTPIQVFTRIALPLSRPGLVSAVIFTFAQSWNEFMMSMLLVTDPKTKTFQVSLYDLLNSLAQRGAKFGTPTAAAILGLIPILIVYAIFQKGFMEGLSAGSIK